MEWKKVSSELSDFLEQALLNFNCEKKKMFGCPVYFVNGNMFAGVHSDNLFIRLSEHDREEIFGLYDEVFVFEPMAGRKMKEYVVIPDSVMGNNHVLNEWLERSFFFVSTLSPKDKTVKKNTKKS